MKDSRVHDFLGNELNVGDVIVYPCSFDSAAHIVKCEIAEIVSGKDRFGRIVPKLKVHVLADSRFSGSRRRADGKTNLLTNLDRCVRVEKRSPVTVDLAGDA